MQRQLEPEVMDSEAEAVAYDRMDHAEVNRLFVDDLLNAIGALDGETRVIDLGAGTAQIPIELCRRDKRIRVLAVDAAASMLGVAQTNVAAAGLEEQIQLQLVDAKQPIAGRFDVVMSNSLVHHLPEPAVFFERSKELVEPAGLVYVRDLCRPADETEWRNLVQTYAADESPHARQMFADSLKAALTVDEVQQFVAAHGFDRATVSATSDRHWTWLARMPG